MSSAPAPSRTDLETHRPAARRARGAWSLWPGVLLPPIVFLGALSLTYAYVPRACDAQRSAVLHWILVAALAVVLVTGVRSWREYRALGAHLPGDHGTPDERARFVALLGVLSSTFFSVAILAQGIAQWLLSPCFI
jgi:hypothetical protein